MKNRILRLLWRTLAWRSYAPRWFVGWIMASSAPTPTVDRRKLSILYWKELFQDLRRERR
jgi:hypothetical protein